MPLESNTDDTIHRDQSILLTTSKVSIAMEGEHPPLTKSVHCHALTNGLLVTLAYRVFVLRFVVQRACDGNHPSSWTDLKR